MYLRNQSDTVGPLRHDTAHFIRTFGAQLDVPIGMVGVSIETREDERVRQGAYHSYVRDPVLGGVAVLDRVF